MPDDAAQASGKCPKCRGIGAEWNNSAAIPCSDCGGTGRIPSAQEREKAAFWKSQFEAYEAEFTEALDALEALLRIADASPFSSRSGGDEEWPDRARAVLEKHRTKEES